MSTVDYIKNALDEMDRLAAEHIRLQSDPTSEYRVVRAAEQLRDRQEAYVEREARANWLRQLLPVVEAVIQWRDLTEPDGATHDDCVYAVDRLLDALAALDTDGKGA